MRSFAEIGQARRPSECLSVHNDFTYEFFAEAGALPFVPDGSILKEEHLKHL